MLTTVIAILAGVALLSPGFVIVEISQAQGARSSRSDLELALRALFYAVLLHVLASPWTAWLFDKVDQASRWSEHRGAIVLYVVVVLVLVPIAIGLVLAEFTQRVERREGPPSALAAALGVGAARDAFDYAFQQRPEGALVVVELVGHTKENPRLVGGVHGRGSAIGQSPQPHDIYIRELAIVGVDEHGERTLVNKYQPARGVYISADQIARIDFLAEADGEAESVVAPGRRFWKVVFGLLLLAAVWLLGTISA